MAFIWRKLRGEKTYDSAELTKKFEWFMDPKYEVVEPIFGFQVCLVLDGALPKMSFREEEFLERSPELGSAKFENLYRLISQKLDGDLNFTDPTQSGNIGKRKFTIHKLGTKKDIYSEDSKKLICPKDDLDPTNASGSSFYTKYRIEFFLTSEQTQTDHPFYHEYCNKVNFLRDRNITDRLNRFNITSQKIFGKELVSTLEEPKEELKTSMISKLIHNRKYGLILKFKDEHIIPLLKERFYYKTASLLENVNTEMDLRKLLLVKHGTKIHFITIMATKKGPKLTPEQEEDQKKYIASVETELYNTPSEPIQESKTLTPIPIPTPTKPVSTNVKKINTKTTQPSLRNNIIGRPKTPSINRNTTANVA